MRLSRRPPVFSATPDSGVRATRSDYSEAIRLNPRHAEPYYRRGFACHGREEIESAIADYSEAIKLSSCLTRRSLRPTTPIPRKRTGRVCEANFYSGALMALQGRKQDAVRLLRLAATGCPCSFVEWDAARAEVRLLGAEP